MTASVAGNGFDADPRRAVPPLHELLESPGVAGWVALWGRDPVKSALRAASDDVRARLAGRRDPEPLAAEIREHVLAAAYRTLETGDRRSLRGVLNATGVILHTNLGRAPLSAGAAQAVHDIAAGYSNLEYDLAAGGRGSRHVHCASLIARLTGSEAAMVVNNNAAAVALAVNELARNRDVVVSRGELVEIGGSFRLPDVVERSGGRLRAVGTTNRTRIEDYREALSRDTGMILKVHPSNYRIEGFAASVPLADLVELGRPAGVPVVHDLGSGFLQPVHAAGLADDEPSPVRSVQAGADLVTWSGDKLLGGPQAGIVHGRSDLVARLRNNPLARAFRVDKLTLAALESTLHDQRDPARALRSIPVLRMIGESAESVVARTRDAFTAAPEVVRRSADVRLMVSVVGGGSLPGRELPSAGLALSGFSARLLDEACRGGDPPLVGRVERGDFLLDFRTLSPGEEKRALQALASAIQTVEQGASAVHGEDGRG